MSTKYSTNKGTPTVADDIALSDHARRRYRERTPSNCDISPSVAWRRGEDIEHPAVAQSPNEDDPPERVRVYQHDHNWGIAFLLDEAEHVSAAGHCAWTVVTCVDLQGFQHGPARAYLHSHGPHSPEVNDD